MNINEAISSIEMIEGVNDWFETHNLEGSELHKKALNCFYEAINTERGEE